MSMHNGTAKCAGCGDPLFGVHTRRTLCLTCRPPIEPGFRWGTRTCIGPAEYSGRKRAWLMECDCGAIARYAETDMHASPTPRQCQACRQGPTSGERFDAVKNGEHTPTLAPWGQGPPYELDHDARWEDDTECQRFVHEHPSGATLEEIAAVFEITRERVRQIEARALRKLAQNAAVLSAVRNSGLGWGSTCPAGDNITRKGNPTTPARGTGGQR